MLEKKTNISQPMGIQARRGLLMGCQSALKRNEVFIYEQYEWTSNSCAKRNKPALRGYTSLGPILIKCLEVSSPETESRFTEYEVGVVENKYVVSWGVS